LTAEAIKTPQLAPTFDDKLKKLKLVANTLK
jgi:hypothetical protein